MSTFKNRNVRRANESFLVAKRGVAFYNNGTNTHINNSTTGAVVLADGQLGMFATAGAKENKSLAISGTPDTAATVPAFSFYQGTANSANPSAVTALPLWTRPYEKSGDIEARNQILATSQLYERGTNAVYVLGGITALPMTNYGLSIQFKGKWSEEFFSTQQSAWLGVQMTTPNYTASQLATSAPVTEIISRLAYDILRNSSNITLSGQSRGGNWPVVALAVDTNAGTGVALSALTAGTPLPVITTTTGNKSISLTQEQVLSIQAAATAAGVALSSTVVPVNLATMPTVNRLFVVALDRQPAFKDYDPTVKIDLSVGVTSGFNYATVSLVKGSGAKEETNGGKALAKLYKFSEGQRKYGLMTIEDPIIEFPNVFDETETYNVLTVSSEVVEFTDRQEVSPLIAYVCVPTAVKGTPDSGTGAYANIITYLNSWLTSANKLTVQVI